MRSIRCNTFLSLCATLTMAPLVFAQSAQAPQQSSTYQAQSLPEAPSLAPLPSQSQMTLSYAGQSGSFPSFAKRRKAYLYDLLGPGAFVGPAITAGFDQAHDLKVGYPSDGFAAPGQHPAHGAVPEWGEGFSGYSKRYANNFGVGLVGTTARYGLGEMLREDVTYHPCTCTGLLPRASHAVTQAFIAHTGGGRALPSLPALASPFVASEIAVVGWYPARYNASDALRISAPLYIGVPLKNLVTEFLRR